MTFEVTVPDNTPSSDTIHLYAQSPFPMPRVGPRKFRLTLTREQLQLEGSAQTIKYRYTRNGYDFRAAEYLEPDTGDYFWTERGRQATFARDKVQRDAVTRWRWFPPGGVTIDRTSDLEPVGEFLPRLNGTEFRSGQVIEDFYTLAFDYTFDQTAERLADLGYRWVEVDPPWQMVEENGLPKIVNQYPEAPNYPSDDKLLEEISAFKRRGLKVMLQPQHCCTVISTQNRPAGWWDSYFSEITNFLVHFAQLAERAGVEAIHYAVNTDYQAPDADARWRAVFKAIREHFRGQVGEMVWSGAGGGVVPDGTYITWADELDYFYIAIDAPIASTSNPTDDELLAGAERVLAGPKKLYDRYGKPVFVRTTYFNVKETWRGNSFYDIASVPWYGGPEADLKNSQYAFSPDDQARVIQAYFRAIANRPWIIGYAQFGYNHMEFPLAADLSVRGRPSEDLWRDWNRVIYHD